MYNSVKKKTYKLTYFIIVDIMSFKVSAEKVDRFSDSFFIVIISDCHIKNYMTLDKKR